MAGVIDMQVMRYINLFEKMTKVSTKNCFVYNNSIVFAVPKSQISKAIGKDAINVKNMGQILRRRIKVVPMVTSNEDLPKFLEAVVAPIEFTSVEVSDGSVTINAGKQNKAALIGRERIREKELGDALKNFLHISKFKIV